MSSIRSHNFYATAHAKVFEIQQALEAFGRAPSVDAYATVHARALEFRETLRLMLHYEHPDLADEITETPGALEYRSTPDAKESSYD